MALKDLFNAQSLNQAFPSRLPGTAYGWDTSSTNKEVMIDPEVSSAAELLPSMAVKLSGRAGQVKYVKPVSSADDVPYGYIIYKAKALATTVEYNRMFTVARFGQEMTFAVKSAIDAGDIAYYDTTDHMVTATPSDDTIVLGLAVETVASASDSAPVIATVEIQCPLVGEAAVAAKIGNATLTIKSGSTTKGTFTANASTDVEIDIA